MAFFAPIYLVDGSGQAWQVACTDGGNLTTTAVSLVTTVPYFNLNDSLSAQTWQVTVLTSGLLQATAIASVPAPLAVFINSTNGVPYQIQISGGLLQTVAIGNFNYIKSFNLTGGGQYTLALDSNGILWNENVITQPFVLNVLSGIILANTYMQSSTQDDVEYMCFSNLLNGTDIPRQYNPQPATGGFTLDRISQVGPGAPPTFQATGVNSGGSVTITSWSGSGNIVTFQATNTFTAGELVRLSGFAVSTFFNGLTFSVLGTGLSGSQFEIAFSGYSGGSDSGIATPQYTYNIVSITQPPAQSEPGNPGHFAGILWSAGPQTHSPGNVITIFYADKTDGFPQDATLANQFNAGIPCVVYISLAPLGNGTQLITSIGSEIGGNGHEYWYFTYQINTVGSQFVEQPLGNYELSLATLTVSTPIPGLSDGDQIIISGATPSAWNSTWTVVNTPNSGIYTITQTSMAIVGSFGVATYTWSWAGSGAPIPPVAGQLVTVIQTLNGNGIFNVVDGSIASVSGGPSSGTFTIGGFAPQTIPAAPEDGQAQTSGTIFQFDPGQPLIGTQTSPIYGSDSGTGVVIVVGSNTAIGAGTRQGVVFFETRSGFKTAVSPPITFTTDITANYILASNIPIGPPNVIRRWIAFTGAGPNSIPGPNFYTIDTPIDYTINNQTYRYSATYIDDNISTTAKFSFTDAILLSGDEIDVQANDLFNEIELGSSAWCIAYANRMMYGLEQNKVLNFNNLSFDGGYLPTSSGITSPLGWSLDPGSNAGVGAVANITAFSISGQLVAIFCNNNFTSGLQVQIAGLSVGTYLNGVVLVVKIATSTEFIAHFIHSPVSLTSDSGTATPLFAGGELLVSPIFGNSYYITNQLGTTQGTLAMITQSAYWDAYNVPIILPNTLYSVRVTARVPSGKTGGTLIVDLTDSNTGNVSGTGTATVYGTTYGSFSVPFASMTGSMLIFTGTILTTPFTQGVPPGLLLRVWAQNIVAGADVEVDRIEIFPTAQPTLTTNIRVSYEDNFEAFDAVTGNIGLAEHNTQAAFGAFILHDGLYFLKSTSMESTQDVPGVEPSEWSVHEVSNRVGACGIHAYDYGEEWVLTACRNGIYGFNGGQPMRIDFQQKEVWEAINWKYGYTIWLRNDLPNRRILCGVPLPTPNQWLPLAPVNASPTSPNVVIMWNYQGLGNFEELVSGQGMHTTMFGNLVSTDMRLKCSLWNITSPYAGFIVQPDLSTQSLLICNGIDNEKIYRLSPAQLSDDGVAINSRYFTFGFVGGSKATEFPLLGAHRKTFSGMQTLVSGVGAIAIQTWPNYILTPSTLTFNPRAYTVPPFALSETPTDDYWRPLNTTGNRVYFSFGTNAVGSSFRLSKLIAVGVMAPFGSVNPNVQ